MGRSKETFNKKEVKKKKEKKRKEKAARKLERKDKEKAGSLEEMFAYVDENGFFVDEPVDPSKKKKTKLEDIEINIPKREAVVFDPIRKGTVSFFNHEKGFGFIVDSETQDSIFVHINGTLEEIKENNLVSFEIEPGQKGPTAVKVKIIR